jgi:nucleotide-binding universal stress UspA family protein
MNARALRPRGVLPKAKRSLRMCLAVDGSAAAGRAAAFAIRLSAACSAPIRIDVVSVDAPLMSQVAARLGAAAVERYHADNHLHATKRVVARLRRAGLEPAVHLYVDREPAEALRVHLATVPADLLLAGSHGRSPMRAWVLGSVVSKLLSSTSVPVLVVR